MLFLSPVATVGGFHPISLGRDRIQGKNVGASSHSLKLVELGFERRTLGLFPLALLGIFSASLWSLYPPPCPFTASIWRPRDSYHLLLSALGCGSYDFFQLCSVVLKVQGCGMGSEQYEVEWTIGLRSTHLLW